MSMDREYFFIPTVHLRRSPFRPHEVGIPIQYLQSAASSSYLGTPVTQPLATKGPRPPAVRIACVSCRHASRKCSERRPCERCIQRGIADTCVNAPSAKGKKVVDAPSTIAANADPGLINDGPSMYLLLSTPRPRELNLRRVRT
ncbi:hypothetical protein L227DRAFT_615807 [Lentinus tigrinus ALCF2SS1-6]|uniref:Transcription activator of gluconeogenesis ERT1 n=1 Tax=Lentinus tigrinus ALCF2SS1-6 TaxID=1328759 RepID=A0A5C2RTK7_9APHY|nr:hypothetical protein L227DRAFT_615807 [Lentinus tigrinus ALCF2SS1-6]